MARLAVVAQFRTKPGCRDKFVEHALVDARASVANEAGCRRFDVLVPGDGEERVVLYEIYDDQAAFDAHLKTPHLAAFRAGIADLVEERDVRSFAVTENAKP